MSEMAQLINECLFGSGALIGLGVIISLALLVSVKVKGSSLIWMVVLLFLAIEYLNRITATSMHAWYFLISLVSVAFLGFILYRDIT